MVMTRIVEGVHTCKVASPGVDHPLQDVEPEARDTQVYVHTPLSQDREKLYQISQTRD